MAAELLVPRLRQKNILGSRWFAPEQAEGTGAAPDRSADMAFSLGDNSLARQVESSTPDGQPERLAPIGLTSPPFSRSEGLAGQTCLW